MCSRGASSCTVNTNTNECCVSRVFHPCAPQHIRPSLVQDNFLHFPVSSFVLSRMHRCISRPLTLLRGFPAAALRSLPSRAVVRASSHAADATGSDAANATSSSAGEHAARDGTASTASGAANATTSAASAVTSSSSSSVAAAAPTTAALPVTRRLSQLRYVDLYPRRVRQWLEGAKVRVEYFTTHQSSSCADLCDAFCALLCAGGDGSGAALALCGLCCACAHHHTL